MKAIDRVLQMVDEAAVPMRVSLYGMGTNSTVGGKIWAMGMGPDGALFTLYGPCPVNAQIAEAKPQSASILNATTAQSTTIAEKEGEKQVKGYQRLGTYAVVRRDDVLKLVELSRITAQDEGLNPVSQPNPASEADSQRKSLPKGALYHQKQTDRVGTRGSWVF